MHFQFDVPFQRSLLRLCMLDEAFCFRAMKHIEAGFFTARPLGWIFATLKRYFDAYGLRCTDMPLLEAAKEHPEFGAEVQAVVSIAMVVESDYIKQELREFIRRNIFAKAHLTSQQFYNDGQHIKAYDLMCEAMDELRLVEFETVDRTWLFDDLQERSKRRYWKSLDPTSGVYPVGIDQFDDAMDGGPRMGEVHLVLGIPKVGKSIWLINRGFVGVRLLHVPVLHFNLEGSTRQCEDRYDACFTGELYTNVRRGEINAALYREMMQEYESLKRLLVIRTINSWDATATELEMELSDLKKTHGFVPEMIIVDYVDLLRSRTKVDTERDHQTNAMKDIKALANRGYCIWSACQGQRPKTASDEKEWILKSNMIADAYAKIRIADGYGSLNVTRAEREGGECRYFLEGWRDGPVGRLYRLKNEMNKMRMGTGMVEKKEEE